MRRIPAREHERDVDVVVLGGGPAGTATARALALGGRSVVVLERSRYETPRLGETVPPEIRFPLTELGLWGRFTAAGHLASPGNRSVWGGPDVYHDDFIVNPFGHGWHLDRRGFDLMLALAAEEAGAEVWPATRAVACLRQRAGGWRVDAIGGDGPRRLVARILVDATGRSANPSRRLGGGSTGSSPSCETVHGPVRLLYDRHVGIVGIASDDGPGASHDRCTLVVAVESGWWYTAPTPGGHRIIAFMTDADLLPRDRSLAVFWEESLRHAHHIVDVIGSSCRIATPRVVPANTSRLRIIARDDRLAVGDAAVTFDPLSSQGVYFAMESALEAAAAIHRVLDGDPAATEAYSDWASGYLRAFLSVRCEHYGRERRWPTSTFWRRRASTHETARVSLTR